MKNKRSIERQTRIRGWFPSEPKIGFSNLNQKPARNQKRPTNRERLTGGLAAAGGSFVLQGFFFHFVGEYPQELVNALIIIGIPFLVAAFLVSRKQKKE